LFLYAGLGEIVMRGLLLHSLGALAAMLITSGAQGAVIVTAVEASGDVVFSMPAGGSIDLTGLTFLTDTDNVAEVWPSLPLFIVGNPSGTGDDDVYSSVTTIPGVFGSGSLSGASFATGSSFGLDQSGNILLPDGYISGALLGASTATFSGKSFANMGITSGTYVWSWAADSVTLNIVPTSAIVPIPAAFWLFGSALGLLGWIRRKKA
jgi:hypothetical protein